LAKKRNPKGLGHYYKLPQQYNQKNIKKYKCKILINEMLHECELVFHIYEMKWYITELK